MSLAFNGHKQCNFCKIEKPVSEYWKDSSKLDGLATYCNICKMRFYNADIEESRKAGRKAARVQRLRNPILNMLMLARSRAKRFSLPFNISKEDVVMPEYCSILKVKLGVAESKVAPSSPSLDRIIPELGYVKNNVQIISHKANTMKSNATIAELLLFADWVYRTYGHLNLKVDNLLITP